MQQILFGGIRPQTRLAYVETHNKQCIISSITVQSHDFLVVCGHYITLMKTLFHGWAHKASNRRTTASVYTQTDECSTYTPLFDQLIHSALVEQSISKPSASAVWQNKVNLNT